MLDYRTYYELTYCMENSVDPDLLVSTLFSIGFLVLLMVQCGPQGLSHSQHPHLADTVLNRVHLWFISFSKKFIYGFSTLWAKPSSLCIVCFLGQVKIYYGHLLVPGQSYNFYTPGYIEYSVSVF